MNLKKHVGGALEILVGLPLIDVTRSLDLEMFQFGERHVKRTPQGEDLVVGDWAIHIQCPWRIIGGDDLVVGSQDRHYPQDEEGEWNTQCADVFTRCEAHVYHWLNGFSDAPLVREVEADPYGGFRVHLEGDYALEVFPAHSLRGEFSEQWRLFRPLTNTDAFIMTGHGVEDETERTGMWPAEH